MLGGMNPAQMKKLMQQMGIKNTEIETKRVVIEKTDGGKLVLDTPNVVMIEMGGQKSFQITGEYEEVEGNSSDNADSKEPTDVDLVMDGVPGATKEEAEKALKDSDGDIAEAIMKLSK